MNVLMINEIEAISETATQIATTAAYNANDLMKMTDESIGGRFLFGLQVTGLGLLIVFSILALLWFIIAMFGKIMVSITAKQANQPIIDNIVEEEPQFEQTAEIIEENNDEELIAVLSAAITAYNEANYIPTEETTQGFRIVSFKERKKVI